MSSAPSATFSVTKTADTCDSDCSLREAIIAANSTDGVDTVMLPAGVYNLSIAGNSEDLSAAGDLDVTVSVNIVGATSEGLSAVFMRGWETFL